MVNLLIIEDDLYYIKNLINLLLSNNSNLRLYKISTDGKEALDIILRDKKNIDIILLDLNLPNLNGIEIFKEIESRKLTKYKKSIIVVSGEIDLISQVIGNPYLYTYTNKLSGFETILKKLNDLIKIKEDEKKSLDYRIYNELDYLNYNLSYVGTNYLQEAIKLLYSFTYIEDIKIEKTIYNIISKSHKKSINSIKTNIINATNLMCYDCEIKKLNKYFSLYNNEKPTPKMVMMTIVKKLKYEL